MTSSGPTIDLLDANLLIALVVVDHVHHEAAESWFVGRGGRPFATCPITQGSLVRFLVREGASAGDVQGVVRALVALDEHQLWPDDIGFDEVDLTGVLGHRQVTDAYLAALARVRGGRLATLDRGLVALHPDVADLVPT